MTSRRSKKLIARNATLLSTLCLEELAALKQRKLEADRQGSRDKFTSGLQAVEQPKKFKEQKASAPAAKTNKLPVGAGVAAVKAQPVPAITVANPKMIHRAYAKYGSGACCAHFLVKFQELLTTYLGSTLQANSPPCRDCKPSSLKAVPRLAGFGPELSLGWDDPRCVLVSVTTS